MTLPPIPIDFGQLSHWLIMPATLILLSRLVITTLGSRIPPNNVNVVQFVVYVIIALASYALTLLSPTFVQSIEPLWAILATVITLYYTQNAIKQLWYGAGLLHKRLLLGRDAFTRLYQNKPIFLDMAKEADD